MSTSDRFDFCDSPKNYNRREKENLDNFVLVDGVDVVVEIVEVDVGSDGLRNARIEKLGTFRRRRSELRTIP